MMAEMEKWSGIRIRSGGDSYGAKELKPPDFAQAPPPDFCVKWDFYQWQLSLSAITEGLRGLVYLTVKCKKYLTVKCKKNAFGGQAPPGPAGRAYSAPQTP